MEIGVGALRIGVALQADSAAGIDVAASRLSAAGYGVPDPHDAPCGQRSLSVTDPGGMGMDVSAWESGAA